MAGISRNESVNTVVGAPARHRDKNWDPATEVLFLGVWKSRKDDLTACGPNNNARSAIWGEIKEECNKELAKAGQSPLNKPNDKLQKKVTDLRKKYITKRDNGGKTGAGLVPDLQTPYFKALEDAFVDNAHVNVPFRLGGDGSLDCLGSSYQVSSDGPPSRLWRSNEHHTPSVAETGGEVTSPLKHSTNGEQQDGNHSSDDDWLAGLAPKPWFKLSSQQRAEYRRDAAAGFEGDYSAAEMRTSPRKRSAGTATAARTSQKDPHNMGRPVKRQKKAENQPYNMAHALQKMCGDLTESSEKSCKKLMKHISQTMSVESRQDRLVALMGQGRTVEEAKSILDSFAAPTATSPSTSDLFNSD